jgi:hypothetical protein
MNKNEIRKNEHGSGEGGGSIRELATKEKNKFF